MNKANQSNNAKIKINCIEWYIPPYALGLEQQKILSKQILGKIPMEPQFSERTLLMEELITRTFWPFELRTQEGIKIPIWTIVGFQQRDRQNSQHLNNDAC